MAFAATARRAFNNTTTAAPLARRQIGRTGVEVTQLGYGTAPIGES